MDRLKIRAVALFFIIIFAASFVVSQRKNKPLVHFIHCCSCLRATRGECVQTTAYYVSNWSSMAYYVHVLPYAQLISEFVMALA